MLSDLRVRCYSGGNRCLENVNRQGKKIESEHKNCTVCTLSQLRNPEDRRSSSPNFLHYFPLTSWMVLGEFDHYTLTVKNHFILFSHDLDSEYLDETEEEQI